MFRTIVTFLCILCFTFSIFAKGQDTSPTLGRNNIWTGTNSFQFGKFSLTGSITQCGSGLVMNGFQSTLIPNCVAVVSTGSSSVTSVFGRVGVVVAASGDYSVAQITGASPLTSPAFTGVPTAPTATLGTNTTQIATTAFVLANSGLSGMTSGQIPVAASASTVSSSKPLSGSGAGIVTGPTSGIVAGDAVSFTGTTGQVQDSGIALSSLAPKASPALTGTPTAPTQAVSTNNTDIATTQAVTSALVPLAPLANPVFTGVLTAPSIVNSGLTTGNSSPCPNGSGGALTNTGCTASNLSGTPALPNGTTATTQSTGDNTTKIATDAFVIANTSSGSSPVSSVFGRTGAVTAASGDYSVSQVTGAAPIASPALTGNPTAPTQATGDNSTKIATDAFVLANSASRGANSTITSLTGLTVVPALSGVAVATTTGSTCGTLGAVTGGLPNVAGIYAGTVVIGSTTCQIKLNFGITSSHGYLCLFSDITNAGLSFSFDQLGSGSSTTTSCTSISATGINSGDTVAFTAFPY
jgi:hypothetical protein